MHIMPRCLLYPVDIGDIINNLVILSIFQIGVEAPREEFLCQNNILLTSVTLD